jgi:Holliday junction DNA helicase RuvA
MIAKLYGLLDSVFSDRLVLNVGGVGYEVFASRRTLSQAGQPGDTLALLIDTHVREDYIHLFGFSDAAEQQWFRLLTSVQGVGPKAGLAILGVCPVDRLGFAIASGDASLLRQADGVGPKLATRIVTELKDKAAKMDVSAPIVPKAKKGAAPIVDIAASVDNDAVSALVNLGYQRTDAYSAVLQAKKKANDNSTLQDLIRLALKELSS